MSEAAEVATEAESNSADGALFSPQPQQIEVYPSGEFVDLLDPDPATIHLRDIAHHLAMACRYAGGIRLFYSVAEHSALVHDLIPHVMDWNAQMEGHAPRAKRPIAQVNLQRAALLHDAAEAYTGDATAPLKFSMRLAGATYDGQRPSKPILPRRSDYDEVAVRLDKVIGERFDVDHLLFHHPELVMADLWAMKMEAARLTASGGSNWRWPGALPYEGRTPFTVEFAGGMRPEYAKARFNRRAMDYWPDEYR